MKKIILFGIFLAIIGVSVIIFWYFKSKMTVEQSVSESTVSVPIASEVITSDSKTTGAKIVFAADFSTGTGCAAHKSGGCDIYSADIGWNGDVSNVRQLSSDRGVEAFPVFSADGSTVYANNNSKGKSIIEWISYDGSSKGILIEDATSPAPLLDRNSLVYVALPDYQITTADFLTSTSLTNISTAGIVGEFHEPHTSVTNKVVFTQLFNEGRGSNTAQVKMFDPATNQITSLTPSDGTAHCFWNGTGTSAVCSNAELFNGLFTVDASGSPTAVSKLLIRHPTSSQIAKVDDDFAQCRGASYAYGTFCDATHMIVTVGCGVETDGVVDTTMSKLGLLDMSSTKPELIPIGKYLADAFGGPGVSSYTVDCLVKDIEN